VTPSSAAHAAQVASPNAADPNITATFAAANQSAAPTGIVLNGNPVLQPNGKEVCQSVNNTTNHDITLTWAVYSIDGVNAQGFPQETLRETHNVTVPAGAQNFEVCTPTTACSQFDLLQFDLVQSDLVAGGTTLPPTYNTGTATFPPGVTPFISTTGQPIPVLAAVVTNCGTGNANNGLGNGVDGPPPGFTQAGFTQQNDDPGHGPGNPNQGFNQKP